MVYIHRKTGGRYLVRCHFYRGELISHVTNKSEGNEGQKMVLYSDSEELYVCDFSEFHELFRREVGE